MTEGEEIEVPMFVWKGATAPDWLTTFGSASCIAVAVADDAAKRAWLLHDPSLSQSIAPLEEMLREAMGGAPDGEGLSIWMLGATQTNKDAAADVKDASAAIRAALDRLAPKAARQDLLGQEAAYVEVKLDAASGWQLRAAPSEPEDDEA